MRTQICNNIVAAWQHFTARAIYATNKLQFTDTISPNEIFVCVHNKKRCAVTRRVDIE